MKAPHRCQTTGKMTEIEARYDEHANWWITRPNCCESNCTQYHEEENL